MHPIIFIVLAVAVAGAIAWYQWKIVADRRGALSVFAAGEGYRFDAERRAETPPFAIFERGHGHAAFDTMHFSLALCGRRCSGRAGDFRYKVTSGSGKLRRTTTHRFSYVLVDHPFSCVPELLIRREGFLDKIADAFGFDDIDFESEEFSRRYRVKSPDKEFAFDVVHPRMIVPLTEDRIVAARRFFNGNVRELRSLCEMFPSSMIASMGGFTAPDFFELDSTAERSVPGVAV